MEDITLHAGLEENSTFEEQPHTDASSGQNSSGVPPSGREAQRAHYIQIWLLLLGVICLGSLGSLSLVPYMLPGLMHSNNATDQRVRITHPIIPTSISGPFMESECTASTEQMKYQPSAGTTAISGNQEFPPTLLQAGRNQKDFANAQACAAAFINAYQTFNAGDPKTFEASVSMLTKGAKQRFYGKAPNTQSDIRMNMMWRATLLKRKIQQTVQSSQPALLAISYTNSQLLIWMVVSYQATIQVEGSKAVIQNDQYSVLLLGVPINTQKTGTGWQVSQWQEGNTQFAAPQLL